jgi:SpoVK/Ycf46/Vps4 family AAA+-type ATPase
VGKTTLARLIANESGRPFHSLSAIHSGVKDVRQVLDSAKRDGMFAGKSVLFIDEIHRFSKSQQDSLLGAVEAGTVTLIGATTENPSFEVIPALRSRCQVYVLQPLSVDVLLGLVNRAIREDKYLSQKEVDIVEHEALIRMSGGDARRLLNALELIVDSMEPDEDGTFKVQVTKGDKAYPVCDKASAVHTLAYTATSFRTLADDLSVKPAVVDDLSVAELLIALNKKIDATANKGDRAVKCSADLADALAETLRIAEAELEAKDTAVVLQIADLRAA